MPNTINVNVLRKRYLEKYGVPCTLSYSTTHELWSLTRTSNARGAGVSPQTLEERAARTLESMHRAMEMTS